MQSKMEVCSSEYQRGLKEEISNNASPGLRQQEQTKSQNQHKKIKIKAAMSQRPKK